MAAILDCQVAHRADLTSSPHRTFVPNVVLVSQFARLVPLSAPLTGKSHRISLQPMTQDDCDLWFMQLEDVFSSQGITSQITKFDALTTLLAEDEAYVVRDLTLMGNDCPMDVFDAAKRLFIHQYERTVHQRLSQAFAMGGIQADEKHSQWTARVRHTGSEWDR